MFAIPTSFRRLALRSVGLIGLVALLGADDAIQTVDADGLTFEAPKSWKSTPAGGMRRVVLDLPPAKGEETGAKLIVFAFPGGAGGVEANVERWEKTFKGTDGEMAKAKVEKKKGKDVDVTRVEISGHYHPTAFPGRPADPDIDEATLLGAIVITKETGFFIRLVGPDKLIKEATPDFDKMIASMKTK